MFNFLEHCVSIAPMCYQFIIFIECLVIEWTGELIDLENRFNRNLLLNYIQQITRRSTAADKHQRIEDKKKCKKDEADQESLCTRSTESEENEGR